MHSWFCCGCICLFLTKWGNGCFAQDQKFFSYNISFWSVEWTHFFHFSIIHIHKTKMNWLRIEEHYHENELSYKKKRKLPLKTTKTWKVRPIICTLLRSKILDLLSLPKRNHEKTGKVLISLDYKKAYYLAKF